MNGVEVRLRGPGRAALCWVLVVPSIWLQMRALFYLPETRLAAVAAATSIIAVLHHRTKATLDGAVILVVVGLGWTLYLGTAQGHDGLIVGAGVAAVLIALGARASIHPDDPAAAGTLALLGAIALGAASAIAARNGLLATRNIVVVAIGLPAAMAVGTGATLRRTGHDPIGWPVLAPALVASGYLYHVLGNFTPSVLTAIALVLAVVLMAVAGRDDPATRALRVPGRLLARALGPLDTGAEVLARGVARGFHAVVHAVRAALLAVVWVAVILVPWCLQRVTGWRSLAHPSGPDSGWIVLGAAPVRSERSWSPDAAPRAQRRRLARRRLPYSLASTVVLVAVIVGLVSFVRSDEGVGIGTTRDLTDAQNELARQEKVSLYGGTELPDFSSKGLNVADRQRRTWRPDLGRCDARIVVWMFGGSTLFGWDQRDPATIPSKLAELAHDAGVDLEIHNFAVPGDVAFQQHRRLERELAVRSADPDLVVYYDGYNDILAQSMAPEKEAAPLAFRGLLDNELLPLVPLLRQDTGPDSTKWSLSVRIKNSAGVGFVAGARAGAFQYASAIGWTRELLRARKIPFVDYFQPSLGLRDRPVEGEPDVSTDTVDGLKFLRAHLPKATVDLSRALDRTRTPVYVDEVHTNEGGTGPVAAAMLRDLAKRFDLAALSKEPASCR